MQSLVIFTPKNKFETEGTPADYPNLRVEEEEQAQELYMKGGLRQVWALDTKNKGAAVLFEAKTTKDLQAMIDSFPFVKADYADYQIFPLLPYPAFAKPA